MQRVFYEETLEPLMKEAQTGKVRLFFMDASHFVMGGFSGVIWTKVRRFVQTACGRQRYNVLGALDFVSKKIEMITNDTYITSTEVIALIDKLVCTYTADPIKIVLDNARYQRCKAVQEHAEKIGVELIFLPTYSPNLNLIERLWKFVKSEVLNATYQATFIDFKTSIDQCISETNGKHKKRLDSLISEKVQLFDSVIALKADVA